MKKNCLIYFIFITFQALEAQTIFEYRSSYISQYEFKSIFFINDDEFIVRNNTKVSKFSLTSSKPLLEEYKINYNWELSNLLHLDHKYIVTTDGVYHHNFFKEIRKVFPFPVKMIPHKYKDPFVSQKLLFYRPMNAFIVSDNKKRVIHILSLENGSLETVKLNIQKEDEIYPLTNEVVLIKKKYDKKLRERKYLLLNFRTQQEVQIKEVNPILVVSDTLAFVRSNSFKFLNIKTGELYDWVNSLTNPNLQCCNHLLSQNGRYIISRHGALTFSVYDIEKRKILTSSEFKRETNYWNTYDTRMKDVIPNDMYYPIDDIEVTPDGKNYIFSEQNGWVLVTTLGDYRRVMAHGKYYQDASLKRTAQTSGTGGQSQNSGSIPTGVKELNLNFQSEYRYQWFNSTGTYKEMQVKIVVTPNTIQEYIWGRGAYVEWGGPCTIVYSKNEIIGNKNGLLYICSSGKKYFFYSDKGINAVRVETSQNNVFDYLHDLPK